MENIYLKILVIAVSFLLLAITARLISKSWLSPGAFFSLYWCIAVCAPLFLSPYNRVSTGAVIWIFLSTATFGIGDFIGSIGRQKNENAINEHYFSDPQILFIQLSTAFYTILGFAAVVITLHNTSKSFDFLFSINTLIDSAKELSHERYYNTYRTGLSQFLAVFVYAGPLLSGLLISLNYNRRSVIIAFISFCPAILMTVIMTLRGYFIISVILWISSYLAMQIVRGNKKLFTKKYIIAAASTFGVIVTVSFLATLFRYGLKNILNFYSDVSHCAFGHIEVFSAWFSKAGLSIKNPELGSYTFAGVFSLLGIRPRSVGLYDEIVILSTGNKSNIYTIFRGLLEDFTPVGSLILLFILSFLLKLSFQKIIRGNPFYMPVLAAFYATVLWSFTCSIWIWNSMIASYLLFATTFWTMLNLYRIIELLKRYTSKPKML